MIGANKAIFALSQQMTNNTPGNFALNLLTPGGPQALQASHPQSISTQNGQVPSLITAWNAGTNTNVYVVLSSTSSANSVTILSYSVDDKGTFTGPKSNTISVNDRIVSITATADQLFMLLGDGSIVSTPSGAIASPTSVLINQPLAPTLAADAQGFTATTTVPTVTTTAQKGSVALTISPPSQSNSPTLSAGMVTGTNAFHLFIGDPASHRVLDLTLLATSGNNAQNASVTLSLVQQYTSPAYFNTIKSVAIDPSGATINILGQNASASESLVQVSANAQNACASQAG